MIVEPQLIKYFPEYDQVFQGDLSQYSKHFLPICSINLKCIYPDQDQWLHFVSVKEIYDGCVGQETKEYHSEYCKEDMIGFDVIGDKYCFTGDWNYFVYEKMIQEGTIPQNQEMVVKYRANRVNIQTVEDLDTWLVQFELTTSPDFRNKLKSKHTFFITPDSDQGLVENLLDRFEKEASESDYDSVIGAYKLNTKTYELAKAYYHKHGKIYPMTIGNYSTKIETMESLEKGVEDNLEYIQYPEIAGILDDIQFQSKEDKDCLEECEISFEEAMQFEDSTNLTNLPYDAEGNIFTYIGRFTGYLFQQYGADSVYLFYNKELKKAVICLEYT
ncbi:hypothetical protein [Myroides profundi]|uniref:Siderophore biosynthesis protein n=1 Tax=Myroides profundi TaxID=480520 RepID=A0AAJ5BFD6_MYRPR|nr:hypothetical protein [Myroides profundi]AJH15386.1 hypothetical protein MPR_2215 [Myroides profundi]SER57069.1 hypothetical protein SAMN04488089_11947 [Myroides profundi]